MKQAKFHPFWILKKYRTPLSIPKLAKIAVFGAKMGHFWPQNESECQKLFLSLLGLKVDEVCQVSSILEIKKVQKCPHLSQKQPTSQFLGQKWAIFGLKMSQECLKLFLSSPALKVDLVCQVLSILDIVKVQRYLQLSQNKPKTKFWGAKIGHFWP